jgi:hypothetical protein
VTCQLQPHQDSVNPCRAARKERVKTRRIARAPPYVGFVDDLASVVTVLAVFALLIAFARAVDRL